MAFDTIEIRVRKGTPEGPNASITEAPWSGIPATEFAIEGGYKSEEPEKLAAKAAAVPGVWEVRWNWGGSVAGIGQGHYVPGEEYKNRYPFLREATE